MLNLTYPKQLSKLSHMKGDFGTIDSSNRKYRFSLVLKLNPTHSIDKSIYRYWTEEHLFNAHTYTSISLYTQSFCSWQKCRFNPNARNRETGWMRDGSVVTIIPNTIQKPEVYVLDKSFRVDHSNRFWQWNILVWWHRNGAEYACVFHMDRCFIFAEIAFEGCEVHTCMETSEVGESVHAVQTMHKGEHSWMECGCVLRLHVTIGWLWIW